MTTLMEKSLLAGFGIFILITFFSLITPFLGIFLDYNQNQKEELDDFLTFFNEVDKAIDYVILNPEETYIKSIYYPTNLNITFIDNYVKYYYFFDNENHIRIFEYSSFFVYHLFFDINSRTYILNVSNSFLLIDISFI